MHNRYIRYKCMKEIYKKQIYIYMEKINISHYPWGYYRSKNPAMWWLAKNNTKMLRALTCHFHVIKSRYHNSVNFLMCISMTKSTMIHRYMDTSSGYIADKKIIRTDWLGTQQKFELIGLEHNKNRSSFHLTGNWKVFKENIYIDVLRILTPYG